MKETDVVRDLEVLRKTEVLRRLGVGPTKLWRMCKNGEFPAAIEMGSGRAVGWLRHEVDAWLSERPRVKL